MKEKDKKIIEDAEKNNIPIFVFTAKDKLSSIAIQDYAIECRQNMASEDYINSAYERINEFIAWQKANPDKVKLPD